MSERPIEEVIGWEWDGRWLNGRNWRTTDGHIARRAEVDDLAAWLTHHEYAIMAELIAVDGQALTWRLSNQWGEPGGESSITAPTIRDALVAAVRQVAEQ